MAVMKQLYTEIEETKAKLEVYKVRIAHAKKRHCKQLVTVLENKEKRIYINLQSLEAQHEAITSHNSEQQTAAYY
jgi:hypothetical protein